MVSNWKGKGHVSSQSEQSKVVWSSVFCPFVIWALGELQKQFPSKEKMLGREEGFVGSKPTLANVPISFYAFLQPVLLSGAAGSLRLDLAFPLGSFHGPKGVPGHAEPVGVLIRACVFLWEFQRLLRIDFGGGG